MADAEYVDIRDFKGADETGRQESTKDIQRAMIEAVSVGKPLLMRAGVYRTKTLNAPSGLVMNGYHPGGYGVGVLKETKLALIANTDAHLLVGAVGSGHVRLNRIHFDGNKNNNNTGNLIHLDDTNLPEECQWHIRDCFIDAAAGHGIYVGAGRRAVQISDCTANYCRLNGIRVNGSDAHVDRCILGSNMVHGIGIGGTVCNVSDCDIYGNGTIGDRDTGDGIAVYSTISMVILRANRVDRNKRNGILVSRDCEAVVVANNLLHSNSQHENGVFHGINIQSTNASIVVHGNSFGTDGNVSARAGYGVFLASPAMAIVNNNVMQKGATVYGVTNANI